MESCLVMSFLTFRTAELLTSFAAFEKEEQAIKALEKHTGGLMNRAQDL